MIVNPRGMRRRFKDDDLRPKNTLDKKKNKPKEYPLWILPVIAVSALGYVAYRRYFQRCPPYVGYLWITLTLGDEGVSGWRELIASASRAAKSMNYALVSPCVRDSQLVCCFTGPLAAAFCDPVGVGHKEALKAANARMLSSRRIIDGLPDGNLSEYMDISGVVEPSCLSGEAQLLSAQQIEDSDFGDARIVVMHDSRKGIFGLKQWREPEDKFPETAARFLFGGGPVTVARGLRREARQFGTDYDAIIWRSELVKPEDIDACVDALIATAETVTTRLVFVSDVALDGRRIWKGHSSKRPESPSLTNARLRLVQRFNDLGVERFETTTTNDVGKLGLIEQVIAAQANTLWTQRAVTNSTSFKVRLGKCGWEGRFLNTILAARHARNRPTLSWWGSY